MNEPISIKEILAIILKRGKAIICVCLAAAVLAGAFQLFIQWRNTSGVLLSEEERELEYQNAMAEYETQKAKLEAGLHSMEEYLQSHQNYMETSVLMKIDATHRPTSQILLSISGVNDKVEADNLQGDGGITASIVELYMVAWDNADLAAELSRYMLTELQNQELRELVSLTYDAVKETVLIRADALTPEESRRLCDAAYKYVLDIQESIRAQGYDHSLEILSNTDLYYDDSALWETQRWRQNEILNAQSECENYRAELAMLPVPVKADGSLRVDISALVQWCALGALLGFLLACIAILAKYIISDRVENSRLMAALIAAPYLGSVAKVKDIWHRLAFAFAGEPYWNKAEDGALYLSENIAARTHENSTVALISTLNISEDDASIQSAIQMLRSQGHTVTYVNKAYCNPNVIRAIRDNQYIIFAEATSKSSRAAVTGVQELVQQLDGRILGFLLV